MNKENNRSKFLGELETPVNLYERVILNIRKSEATAERRKAFMFGLSTLVFVPTTIFVAVSSFETFIQSGFYHYLSVIFSGENVFAYWKELSLSLVESLPIFGLISLLAVSAASLWSVANTVTSIRKIVLTA
jgi:hypothetical protein